MTLQFEEKWDRTISDDDRKLFHNVYDQNPVQEGKLLFVPVRAAFNHRDHLLASVLIINGVEDWKLEDRLLHYVEDENHCRRKIYTRTSGAMRTLPFHGRLCFILIRFVDRLLFTIGKSYFTFTKNDKNIIHIQLIFSFFRH